MGEQEQREVVAMCVLFVESWSGGHQYCGGLNRSDRQLVASHLAVDMRSDLLERFGEPERAISMAQIYRSPVP